MPSFSEMSWSLAATSVFFVLMGVQPPVITSLKHKNMICDKLEECACGFPTGEGVNLTALASTTLILNDTESKVVFYFNPCTAAFGPCPNNSVICMVDDNSTKPLNLGSKGGSSFSSQGVFGPVFINYNEGDLATEIQLDCTEYAQNTTLVFNENYNRFEPSLEVKYHLLLQSPEACFKPVEGYYSSNVVREGISSGALFLIIMIVLWLAYILIGSVANHLISGATGWEMIPHYEFWRNLPTMLMDGVKFVANGCKPPPSYDQI
ncbi:Cation-dependent mannose-6-phosphate receptor [Frankliniella fusca]|uniref:Cation-dependent mannose-6-phosphate receptor n=1 Tax=Frankliniella fusca TaxID=407009 RepID=A0AAE1LEB7_9NEOP|nr:Cation-dependent mannose-6-phosphate receptor [Frankliniella fusca]